MRLTLDDSSFPRRNLIMIFLNSFVIIILRQIKKKTYLINQMKVRNDSIDTCEKHFGLMAFTDNG